METPETTPEEGTPEEEQGGEEGGGGGGFDPQQPSEGESSGEAS